MKVIVAVFLFLGLAVQADENPTYLGQVKGVVLNSLTDTDDFSFEPGTLKNCVRKTVLDWVVYDCGLEGTSATVQSDGQSRTFRFTTLKVTFRYHKSVGFFAEYFFSGHWAEKEAGVSLNSDVLLTLWHKRSDPNNVKGSLALKNYGMTLPIQAIQ